MFNFPSNDGLPGFRVGRPDDLPGFNINLDGSAPPGCLMERRSIR